MNLKEHLAVLGIFAVLTLIFTYPVPFNPDKMMSDNPKDSLVFMWNMWWVEKAATTNETLWRTDYLYYPSGVSLAYHPLGLGNTAFGALLARWFDYVTAYNLLILAAFPLAGWSMYMLGLYLTKSRSAAFIAGMMYAFSPWHMHRMANHLNFATIQFIPVYILLVVMIADEPQAAPLKKGALTALVLALIFYTNEVYALFMIMFTGIYLAYHLITWRKSSADARSFVGALAVAAGIFALLSAPVTMRMAQERANFTSVRAEADYVDIGNYLRRPEISTFLAGSGGSEYLGISVLVLAALGLLYSQKREKWLWLGAGMAFFAVSLGEWGFYAVGNHVLPNLPLPGLILRHVPLMNSIRYSRMAFMVSIMGIILAAYGAAFLIERFRLTAKFGEKKIALLAPLMVLIIAADIIAVPIIQTTADIQAGEKEAYARIANGSGGPMLNLPIQYWNLNSNTAAARNMYAQTFHQQKIMGGLIARVPPELADELRSIDQWNLTMFKKKVRYVVVNDYFLESACDNLIIKHKTENAFGCDNKRTLAKIEFVKNISRALSPALIYTGWGVHIYDLALLDEP